MIYSMANMEYVEICEITPNIQCHNCIENCTCGSCLRPSDKVRKLNGDRFDVLSITSYVIKKGTIPWETPREYGKTENLLLCQTLCYTSEAEEVHMKTGRNLEMPCFSTITSEHWVD